jgi:hypothetical protein
MSIEVKIGIIQHPHEVELEMDVKAEELISTIKAAIDSEQPLVWLTSKKNNQIGVPASKIAFVEIRNVEESSKKMGFGS